MNKGKIVLSSIGALVLVAIIGVAGWQFNWWIAEKNVNRQVHIENVNKGVQVAWMDEAKNAVSDYNLVDPSNTSARGALRNKACGLIVRLVGPYRQSDLLEFQIKECR